MIKEAKALKGLWIKDWYSIKKLAVVYAVLTIFLWFFFGLLDQTENFWTSWFLLLYPAFLAGLLPISSLIQEEQDRWEVFSGSLPYTRDQLVAAKYSLVLQIAAAAVVLFFAAQMASWTLTGGPVWQKIGATLMILIGIILVEPALQFPVTYRFGGKKSQWGGLLLTGAFWGMSALLFPKLCHSLILSMVFLLAGILVFLISWRLSIRIYRKREF